MAGSEILVECVGKEGYSCKKSKANACMSLYTLFTTYIPICIQVLIYRNMYINVPLCFHSSYSTHTYMSSILSENYFYHTFRIEVAQTNSYRLEQEYIYTNSSLPGQRQYVCPLVHPVYLPVLYWNSLYFPIQSSSCSCLYSNSLYQPLL